MAGLQGASKKGQQRSQGLRAEGDTAVRDTYLRKMGIGKLDWRGRGWKGKEKREEEGGRQGNNMDRTDATHRSGHFCSPVRRYTEHTEQHSSSKADFPLFPGCCRFQSSPATLSGFIHRAKQEASRYLLPPVPLGSSHSTNRLAVIALDSGSCSL